MSSETRFLFELSDDLKDTLLEASIEDLTALSSLGEECEDGCQAEFYTAACFELFSRTHTTKALQKLIEQAEKWLATIETGHPDHARRHRALEEIRKLGDGDNMNSATPQMVGGGGSSHKSPSLTASNELDETIKAAETAVRMIILPAPKINLAALLCQRFSSRNEHQDVYRAVELSRQAVEASDHTDEGWALIVKTYASSLLLRHSITDGGSLDDLNIGIELLRTVLFPPEKLPSTYSISDFLRACLLIDLGTLLETRSKLQKTLDIVDLEQAILMGGKALELTGKNEKHRLARLESLHRRLEARLACSDSTSPTQSTQDRDPNDQERHTWLSRLGDVTDIYVKHILLQPERVSPACFEQALRLSELIEVQSLQSLKNPNESIQQVVYWLMRRSCLLAARSDSTRSIDDIDIAVSLQVKAQDLCSKLPYLQGPVLDLLSDLHLDKFKKSTSPSREDLELAVMFHSKASTHDFAGNQDLRCSQRLHQLARCFLEGLGQAKTNSDVERAVDLADVAYSMIPQQSPDALPIMQTLALGLDERSRLELGDPISDSSRAFEIFHDVMERTPKDHRVMVDRIMVFEKILEQNFKTNGTPGNVNRAIFLLTDLMKNARAPPGHPIHRLLRQTIAPWLRHRAAMTYSAADLAQAAEIQEEAIRMGAIGDGNLSDNYYNLAIALQHQFGRSGNMNTLNRAIEKVTKAIEITTEGSPKMSRRRSLLAGLMSTRWRRGRDSQDLVHSIDMAELSLRDWHQLSNGLLKAELVANLASIIELRSIETYAGLISDLDYAAELFDAAINTGGHRYRFRASMLHRLIDIIARRLSLDATLDTSTTSEFVPLHFRKIQRVLPNSPRAMGPADLDRALSIGSDTLTMASCPASDRLELAMTISKKRAESMQWDEADTVSQQALALLPSISPRSLDNKERSVARFADLAASAVSICLESRGNGIDAMQCSERGRGIINGLLFEMRSDISALEQEHPQLANEFTSIRVKLDNLVASQSFEPDVFDPQAETQASRLRDAESAFNDKLAEIRTLPTFRHFLASPSIEDMLDAANPHPIAVINVTEYRCDALLVHNGRVDILKLPGLKIEDVRQWAEQLEFLRRPPIFARISPLLEWLWQALCHPILDALGFCRPITGTKWPRIWWIPTGIVSRFPLHAAGVHSIPGETVMDRVMSSYASSVRSLIYARSHGSARVRPTESKPRALLVEMSKTPGHMTLPDAVTEISNIEKLCSSMGLETTKLTTVARKSQVLDQIANCNIFHFAGHGSLDTSFPLESKLLLHDWKEDALYLQNLRDQQFKGMSHFLCYLSACSTGVTNDDQLSDEGIHFVSAFQMAGFRHVIGTLWNVADKTCLQLAEAFYESFATKEMTDETVCEGFHHAVRQLRDAQIVHPTPTETLDDCKGKAKKHGLTEEEEDEEEEKKAQGKKPAQQIAHDDGEEIRVVVLGAIQKQKAVGKGFETIYTIGQIAPQNKGKEERQQTLGSSFWVPYVHYGA